MPTLTQLFPPKTVMRIGASGPMVKAVQKALATYGYPLSGTGYFGNATLTAVRSFQQRAGLKPDGEIGDDTIGALDRGLKSDLSKVPEPVKAEIERPLWFQEGLRMLGTLERQGPGDNPRIIDWAKQEGGEIAEDFTHDSIPWCALFANHCLTAAGLQGTETLWALDFAGNWPALRLPGMAVGAFAPMKRKGGGHIMMIAGRDQHGNVMGLGGNQSDAVTIEPFAISRLNQGFWWPKGAPLPAKTGFDSLPIVNSNGRLSSNEA